MLVGTPDMHQENVAATIFKQLGGTNILVEGIEDVTVVPGRHFAGGLAIELNPELAKDNGFLFIVSYHPRDDYTIHYCRKVYDMPSAMEIIHEGEGFYCDMLCEEFSKLTGIEIPIVKFASTFYFTDWTLEDKENGYER